MKSPTEVRETVKSDLELIEAIARYSAATLHEAAGQQGALPSSIKPISGELRICGPALTVRSIGGDNLWLHRAIYDAKPGEVLVAKTEAVYEAGYWGEIMTQAALQRGIAGVIIDGCVRDGDRLKTLGLPIFARGLCIRGATKNKAAVGALRCSVQIGTVVIQAGDVVVGDADGVVIISQHILSQVLTSAEDREKKEKEIMQKLKAGGRTLDIYNLT
jgi:4-hydroxy-4-methyl-2-oxoglutarate aldolase